MLSNYEISWQVLLTALYIYSNLILPWCPDAFQFCFNESPRIRQFVERRHHPFDVVLHSLLQFLDYIWKFLTKIFVFCWVSGHVI